MLLHHGGGSSLPLHFLLDGSFSYTIYRWKRVRDRRMDQQQTRIEFVHEHLVPFPLKPGKGYPTTVSFGGLTREGVPSSIAESANPCLTKTGSICPLCSLEIISRAFLTSSRRM